MCMAEGRSRLTRFHSFVFLRFQQMDAPEGLACSVCEDAVKEGLSLGCGEVGNLITKLCGDAAPLCEAALKLACKLCNSHCDEANIAHDACHLIHVC
jgi:hypothetical protein